MCVCVRVCVCVCVCVWSFLPLRGKSPGCVWGTVFEQLLTSPTTRENGCVYVYVCVHEQRKKPACLVCVCVCVCLCVCPMTSDNRCAYQIYQVQVGEEIFQLWAVAFDEFLGSCKSFFLVEVSLSCIYTMHLNMMKAFVRAFICSDSWNCAYTWCLLTQNGIGTEEILYIGSRRLLDNLHFTYCTYGTFWLFSRPACHKPLWSETASALLFSSFLTINNLSCTRLMI